MARKPGCPGRPARRILASNLPPLGRRTPSNLTGVAAREWRRLAPMFGPLGLTAADLPTLTAYCQQVSQAAQAQEVLARDGTLRTTARGSLQEHPCVRQLERSQALLLKLAGALGCCPSGRKLIGQIPEGESEAEKEQLRFLFVEGERERRYEAARRRRGQEDESEEETEDESEEEIENKDDDLSEDDDPLGDSASKPSEAETSVSLCRVSGADGPGEVAGEQNPTEAHSEPGPASYSARG